MEKFKENKILITVCLLLIGFTLLIAWIFSSNPNVNDEFELSEREYLRNYKVNEIVPVAVNAEKMAKTYLAEYVALMLNKPEAAYSLLDEEYKEKAYPTYQSFTDYISEIKNEKFAKMTLVKYEVKILKGHRVYNLIDLAENNFIFLESSIMNYKVRLDNYTLS